MEEIFREIKGFENLYEVSNLGRIKSLPKGDGNGNRERFLKIEICKKNNTNYNRVSLSRNGKVSKFQVHRLVAKAFIDNNENKPYVNHIDNNGSNNRIDNLEWCTHKENMLHAQRQGRLFKSQSKGGLKGGNNIRSKSIEINKSLVGQIFGSYKIISYKIPERRTRTTFECECLLCNKIFTVEKSNLIRGHSKNCRSCGLKKSKTKDIV